MPNPLRLLAYGGVALGGSAAGLLGSFVHSFKTYRLPVGLVTGFALSLLIFIGAGIAMESRAGTGLAAVGWLLPVLLLAVRRPEGDLIVAATPLGYAWLIGGTALAALSVAWPPRGLRALRPTGTSARSYGGR